MTELLVRDRGRLFSRNLVPGERVYGEKLRRFQGKEYRDWAARRSKLAAYLEKGGKRFRLKGAERILYLGAASGTTVSHLSDLLPGGQVLAVELSPRPFRDLLHLAALRPNIVPLLGDAARPEAYQAFVGAPVDLLVQDIAQRDQAAIFARNVRAFLKGGGTGFLAVKARSVNVAAPPKKIYDQVRRELESNKLKVAEAVDLEPFEKDHAMLVVAR